MYVTIPQYAQFDVRFVIKTNLSVNVLTEKLARFRATDRNLNSRLGWHAKPLYEYLEVEEGINNTISITLKIVNHILDWIKCRVAVELEDYVLSIYQVDIQTAPYQDDYLKSLVAKVSDELTEAGFHIAKVEDNSTILDGHDLTRLARDSVEISLLSRSLKIEQLG